MAKFLCAFASLLPLRLNIIHLLLQKVAYSIFLQACMNFKRKGSKDAKAQRNSAPKQFILD